MSSATDGHKSVQTVGVQVRKAFFCVGVFFILMVLFNGVAMCESARCLEYGRARDFWVAVLQPVARISHASGLYKFREVPQSTLGEKLNQPRK